MALLLGLTGCKTTTPKITPDENIDINIETMTGDLGEFHLLTPGDGLVLESAKTFTWEASENAYKYTLELSSSEFFISDLDNVDYYAARNIQATSFTINSDFEFKDTTYYWRVTAYNSAGNRQCASIHSFYIKAPEVEEVHFDLGEADDWTLHPQGSYADVRMDHSDFFGNGEPSIEIKFKKEDTNQGKPESDGWIIVTKTIEKSIYGTDALFFNLFYAGQQADVVIRMVDRDNEYWYCPVQVSNNAKQSVILKFEDFIQRKRDVPVANEVFDHERIKYLEIVFERSFGDGVFLLGGMKAIKFANYGEFFIDKLNFNDYGEDKLTFENYRYDYTFNGTELVLNHYNTATEEHEKINGYGFLKVNVNRYFVTGDAIRIKVKKTGANGTNVLLRLYEEDTDRWSYKFPYSALTEEYQELIIPYGAFAASSLMGDGRRQFYMILNLQFGCEGQYGNGSIYFKDFEIVKMSEVSPMSAKVLGSDGLVDDFNDYTFTSDLFHVWGHTEVNKDEYMTMNTTIKFGGNNHASGQFEYKSDMEDAMYYTEIDASQAIAFDGFSIWMKDGSMKPNETKVNHVTNWSPKTRLLIQLKTGEIYEYQINPLPTMWNEYNVRFEDFTLSNEDEVRGIPYPITCEGIIRVGFAFQYFYYRADGYPMPMYTQSNPVYVDNVRLKANTTTGVVLKDRIIEMDGDISNFDDFESYETTADVEEYWAHGQEFDYQKYTLSNDVSSEGGNHSVALQYKSKSTSVSYVYAPFVKKDVTAKAVIFDMKSAKAATVYFNVYLTIGSSTQQYRATISGAANVWTRYVIGFNHFEVVSGSTGRSFVSSDMQYIQNITFGIVLNNDTEATLYDVYVDNVKFDMSKKYTAYSVDAIDQEERL